MVATVARNGAGFTTSNIWTYDAWGGVRSGATTGGPKGRYVANLGHVQDDESGLIYMRARYYEPESGRFISEDTDRDGLNWYVYAKNSPNLSVDFNGCTADPATVLFGVGAILMILMSQYVATLPQASKTGLGAIMIMTGVLFLTAWFASDSIFQNLSRKEMSYGERVGAFAVLSFVAALVAINIKYGSAFKMLDQVCASKSIGAEISGFIGAYMFTLALFMAFGALDDYTD